MPEELNDAVPPEMPAHPAATACDGAPGPPGAPRADALQRPKDQPAAAESDFLRRSEQPGLLDEPGLGRFVPVRDPGFPTAVVDWSVAQTMALFATQLAVAEGRVLTVVTRPCMGPQMPRLAAATPARLWLRSDGSGAGGDLEQAILQVLEPDAARDGDAAAEHLFVDVIDLGASPFDLADVLGAGPGGRTEALDPVLERVGARYLQVLCLPPHMGLDVLEMCPTALRLPWTAAWLEGVGRANGLDTAALRHKLGGELNAAECLLTGFELSHERQLHHRLSAEELSFADGVPHLLPRHEAFVAKVREAIAAAATGSALGEEGEALIRAIMAEFSKPETRGEIGRTALTVFALARRITEPELREATRRLLPEGRVPLALLPPEMAQAHAHACEDAVRLYRARPQPPGWADLFQALAVDLPRTIGLRRNGEGGLVAGAQLAQVDVPARVLADGWSMAAFADRLLGRAQPAEPVTRILPDEPNLKLRLLFVDLLRSLYDAGFVQPAELITAFGGMQDPGDGYDWALHLRVLLLRFCTGLAEPDGFLASFLDLLARMAGPRAPEQDDALWILLGYLLVFEPEPPARVVGELTLRRFSSVTRDAFSAALRELRELLNDVLQVAGSRPGHLAAPVERWADGVWQVAQLPEAPPAAVALAHYLDDHLSNAEIPWRPRDLDAPRPSAPVLARRFFCEDGDGAGALLRRLMARPPRVWLSHITALAGRYDESPALVPLDHVAARLRDCFHAVYDDIASDESVRLRGGEARLRHVFWDEVIGAYQLRRANFAGSDPERELATALLAAVGAPARSASVLPLLDLYPAAVLAFWRLRMWPAAPLAAGGAEDRCFVAVLDRLVGGLDAPRLAAIHQAFRALQAGAGRLLAEFERAGMVRTALYHRQRCARLRPLAARFEPPNIPALISSPRQAAADDRHAP
ncbi:hypothetical protein [Xanthobacter sp. ZOL 2024]